jgi:hypothetical protein
LVDIHAPDGLEVEFVLASGKTQALVSLHKADVRAVGDGDLTATLSCYTRDVRAPAGGESVARHPQRPSGLRALYIVGQARWE